MAFFPMMIVKLHLRYNLKRKVAALAPVTKGDFDGRLAKHVAEQAKANASNSGDYCVACSKNFSTEKAYANHIKSKKHIEASRLFDKKENKVILCFNIGRQLG